MAGGLSGTGGIVAIDAGYEREASIGVGGAAQEAGADGSAVLEAGPGSGGAPPVCIRPNLCFGDWQCNGSFFCATNDPCKAWFCDLGAQCNRLPSLPDGTPCDDGKTCSHAYPASAGCPSNRCVGGTADGTDCTRDDQCPGGSCFMNRCTTGPNVGARCDTNDDCTGGAGRADCVRGFQETKCNGGSEAGNHCHLVCVGGMFAGLPCEYDSDCFDGTAGTCPEVPQSPDCPPAGRCTRWSADAATGTCKAASDSPRCDTAADCPTTKYCAADPHDRSRGSESCYDDEDTCCAGGIYAGPCLVWDACDPVAHVCLRTTQGGATVLCAGQKSKYGDTP